MKILHAIISSLVNFAAPGVGLAYLGHYKKALIFVAATIAATWIGRNFISHISVLFAYNFLTFSLSLFTFSLCLRYIKLQTFSVTPKSIGLSLVIFAVFGGIFFTITYVSKYDFYRIPDDSLSPALVQGDRIIFEKKPPSNDWPKTGDLVVIRDPDSKGERRKFQVNRFQESSAREKIVGFPAYIYMSSEGSDRIGQPIH